MMAFWPFKRKKKAAQAPAPAPADGTRDDDTKIIQTKFAESEQAVEDAKKGLQNKVTDVKKKASECVKKLAKQ